MRILSFNIRNFKGIAATSLGVADDSPGNVGTLVGLNESGKTTVLQALSFWGTEDKEVSSLVQSVQEKARFQDLIPKNKKASFNDSVQIEAIVAIDENDKTQLAETFKDTEFSLSPDKIDKTISISRQFLFEESNYKSTSNIWSIKFQVNKKVGGESVTLIGTAGDPYKGIWLKAVNSLETRLPKIVYFPTFLFNFPDRIYLEGELRELDLHYRSVMQDVLDSQGDNLQLEKHIIDRIKKVKIDLPKTSTLISFFYGRDERKQVEAVLQKAAGEMTRVIFGAWNQILGRNVSGKRVQVDWRLDSEKNDAVYLEVSIIDGDNAYSLSERSLGFRWFFSFLLFTQLRKNRKMGGATLFLFDEPASNLHAKAQMKLLESFHTIAQGSSYILYSTHSHYMINPAWLEKAYIVENKATNYDDDVEIDMPSWRPTDIKVTKYGRFVGSHPGKVSYFQPVLDALEIPFSPLIRSSCAVVVEGKFDYDPFVYLYSSFERKEPVELFPSGGAGHSETLINLFRGWGVNFRIILDDDAAGKRARNKYIEDGLVSVDQVKTLGDISSSLTGKDFEGIYQADVVSAVELEFAVKKPKKRQFSLHFQRLLAQKLKPEYLETKKYFKPIADWVDSEV